MRGDGTTPDPRSKQLALIAGEIVYWKRFRLGATINTSTRRPWNNRDTRAETVAAACSTPLNLLRVGINWTNRIR